MISPLPGPDDDARRCTATAKRTGERCTKWAIRGGTVCRTHGGAAPQTRAAAARRLEQARVDREVAQLVADYAETTPADVDPFDILLRAVWRATVMVRVWGDLAAGLALDARDTDHDSADGAGLYGRDHLGDGAPHIIVTEYRRWLTEQARIAKLAIDAGIAERQVTVAETQARQVAELITAVIDDLGLDPDQRTAAISAAGRHLRALDGGAAA